MYDVSKFPEDNSLFWFLTHIVVPFGLRKCVCVCACVSVRKERGVVFETCFTCKHAKLV
jgi:hypothetical protein